MCFTRNIQTPAEKVTENASCVAGDTCYPCSLVTVYRKKELCTLLTSIHVHTASMTSSSTSVLSICSCSWSLPGHNIAAADLHMEHLNTDAKGCFKVLDANKSVCAIQSINQSTMGTIVPASDQLENCVPTNSFWNTQKSIN